MKIRFLLTIALFYCVDTETVVNRLLYENHVFLFPSVKYNGKFNEQAIGFLAHKSYSASYSATSTQMLLLSPFPSFSFSLSQFWAGDLGLFEPPNSHLGECLVCQGCHNKIHRLSGLNNRNVLSSVLEARGL